MTVAGVDTTAEPVPAKREHVMLTTLCQTRELTMSDRELFPTPEHYDAVTLFDRWIRGSNTVISEYSGDSLGDYGTLLDQAKSFASALSIPVEQSPEFARLVERVDEMKEWYKDD